MAIPVYAWLYDDAGNLVKGSSVVAGRENSIEVLSVLSLVEIPADSHTGWIAGETIHQPLYFDKNIDASTPYILKALTSGEKLTSAEFKYYRINFNGQEEHYFSMLLEGVHICSDATLMYDIKRCRGAVLDSIESIALSYETLTWRYIDGNIVHTD